MLIGYHYEEDGTRWEKVLTLQSLTECDSTYENYGKTTLSWVDPDIYMQCPNWETRKVMEIKLDPIETDGSCKSDD